MIAMYCAPVGFAFAVATSIYSSGYDASRAIDGDPATPWHSRDGVAGALTVELVSEVPLCRFIYWPRQDEFTVGNGTPRHARLLVDGVVVWERRDLYSAGYTIAPLGIDLTGKHGRRITFDIVTDIYGAPRAAVGDVTVTAGCDDAYACRCPTPTVAWSSLDTVPASIDAFRLYDGESLIATVKCAVHDVLTDDRSAVAYQYKTCQGRAGDGSIPLQRYIDDTSRPLRLTVTAVNAAGESLKSRPPLDVCLPCVWKVEPGPRRRPSYNEAVASCPCDVVDEQ